MLVGYVAGTVALGVWVGRRQSSDEFMSAGRRVPGWAIGLSIVGTYVSSISFLALPGKAFASDWNAFVFSLGLPPAIWIAVRYFVPFHRAAGALSAYEHLERRFGVWARMYAVVCYLLTQVARVGTILYLLARRARAADGLVDSGARARRRHGQPRLHAVRRAAGGHLDGRRPDRRVRGRRRGLHRHHRHGHARTGRAVQGGCRRRQVQLGQLRRGRRPVHVLGRAALRDLHQPAELRHRPELRPALSGRAVRPRSRAQCVDGRLAVSADQRGVPAHRHGPLRLLCR